MEKEPGTLEAPKTYSEEEYNKLIQERDKFKNSIDKLTSENADYKRKAKDKLSEEEKLIQAQKEKDEALLSAQKELLGIKLTKEFMGCGFEETICEQLVESYHKGDIVAFTKDLKTNINTLVENKLKKYKELAQKNSTYPPNGDGKETMSLGKQKALQTQKKDDTFKWGNFNNKTI